MTMRDDVYGIVSRNAERRAMYGERLGHGTVSTPPVSYYVGPARACALNPFDVPRESSAEPPRVIVW